jgi:hypothetical protein
MRRPLIPAPWSYVLILLVFATLGAYALANRLLARTCIFCGSELDLTTIEANTGVVIPVSATILPGLRRTTYVRYVSSGSCPLPPSCAAVAVSCTARRTHHASLVAPEAVSLIGCTGLSDTHRPSTLRVGRGSAFWSPPSTRWNNSALPNN